MGPKVHREFNGEKRGRLYTCALESTVGASSSSSSSSSSFFFLLPLFLLFSLLFLLRPRSASSTTSSSSPELSFSFSSSSSSSLSSTSSFSSPSSFSPFFLSFPLWFSRLASCFSVSSICVNKHKSPDDLPPKEEVPTANFCSLGSPPGTCQT